MTIFVAQKNESTTITNSNKCDAKSTFILQNMVYLQREANMCQVASTTKWDSYINLTLFYCIYLKPQFWHYFTARNLNITVQYAA